jgi:hypothetical protein
MLTSDQGRITYRERPLPLALRVFTCVIGLGTGFGIPAAWLANVSAQTPWPTLALVTIVVMVCAVFGGIFFLIAFASATELLIDPTQPAVIRTRRGPLQNDTTPIPRRNFGPPAVIMRDAEDGPFPILRLPLPGAAQIDMACFDTRAEAETWCKIIAAALRV